MIPAQRQKKILDILNQHKIISYVGLSEILDVSHMTIRRDVSALEEEGKVVPVAGGVQLVSHLSSEPSHYDKLTLHHNEKTQIAEIASAYIHKNDHSIYLDAGTTCLAIAQKIAFYKDKLFITNDLKIADFLLSHSESQTLFIGGELDKKNYSSIGNIAAMVVRQLNIDLAFISTSSWNKKGLSTPDIRKAEVKKAVVNASMKSILVSDSSKYGQRASYHILGLAHFEHIITDSHFSQTVINTLEEEENITIKKVNMLSEDMVKMDTPKIRKK